MIGGGGESRRVVVRRTSAVRFMRGATVVLDLGFRNDNNETWRGEGIFPKGWCWREEGRSKCEVNWNIYGRGW